MDNKYKELSEKIDLILKQQELILKHLGISSVDSELSIVPHSKPINKRKTEEELRKDITQVILNSHRLKEQFNLAVTPQSHRVLKYLETGNPSVFDGLKRKTY